METGNFKVGAELMVIVCNAPIPHVSTLVGFTSKVKSVITEEERIVLQFENGVVIETNESDMLGGLVTGQLG